MEEKPKVVQKKAYHELLEAGVYFYCTCGLSSRQPFCNGNHEGTSFTPKRFKIPEDSSVYLCGCKYTKNAPYCDGSHKRLPEDVS